MSRKKFYQPVRERGYSPAFLGRYFEPTREELAGLLLDGRVCRSGVFFARLHERFRFVAFAAPYVRQKRHVRCDQFETWTTEDACVVANTTLWTNFAITMPLLGSGLEGRKWPRVRLDTKRLFASSNTPPERLTVVFDPEVYWHPLVRIEAPGREVWCDAYYVDALFNYLKPQVSVETGHLVARCTSYGARMRIDGMRLRCAARDALLELIANVGEAWPDAS